MWYFAAVACSTVSGYVISEAIAEAWNTVGGIDADTILAANVKFSQPVPVSLAQVNPRNAGMANNNENLVSPPIIFEGIATIPRVLIFPGNHFVCILEHELACLEPITIAAIGNRIQLGLKLPFGYFDEFYDTGHTAVLNEIIYLMRTKFQAEARAPLRFAFASGTLFILVSFRLSWIKVSIAYLRSDGTLSGLLFRLV